MDCHLSRLLLAFRRSELTAEDAAALDSHLTGCPACAAAARRDAAERAALTAVMAAVPVPAGLRDRLVRSATRRQWAAWWRTVGRRTTLALLAVVGTGFGIGVYDRLTRPHFATDRFAVQLERERDFTQREVSAWLKGEGLPDTLPFDFDFFWHVVHGKQAVGEKGGREVPFVLFRNGPEECRVYVLRGGQFRLSETALAEFTGSRYRLTTREQGHVIYVIAHTGDTLAPFLKPPAPHI
jgi:hypothetical protein